MFGRYKNARYPKLFVLLSVIASVLTSIQGNMMFLKMHFPVVLICYLIISLVFLIPYQTKVTIHIDKLPALIHDYRYLSRFVYFSFTCANVVISCHLNSWKFVRQCIFNTKPIIIVITGSC